MLVRKSVFIIALACAVPGSAVAVTEDCLDLSWVFIRDGDDFIVGPKVPIPLPLPGEKKFTLDIALVTSISIDDVKDDDIIDIDEILDNLRLRMSLDRTFFPDAKFSVSASAMIDIPITDDEDKEKGIISIGTDGAGIWDAFKFETTFSDGEFTTGIGLDFLKLGGGLSFKGNCTPTGIGELRDCGFDTAVVDFTVTPPAQVPVPASLGFLFAGIGGLGVLRVAGRAGKNSENPPDHPPV